MRYSYDILVGKREGKRQLGRSWRRWQNYITMDRKEGVCWLRTGSSSGLL